MKHTKWVINIQGRRRKQRRRKQFQIKEGLRQSDHTYSWVKLETVLFQLFSNATQSNCKITDTPNFVIIYKEIQVVANADHIFIIGNSKETVNEFYKTLN